MKNKGVFLDEKPKKLVNMEGCTIMSIHLKIDVSYLNISLRNERFFNFFCN
jgi:hypothetical protein